MSNEDSVRQFCYSVLNMVHLSSHSESTDHVVGAGIVPETSI